MVSIRENAAEITAREEAVLKNMVLRDIPFTEKNLKYSLKEVSPTTNTVTAVTGSIEPKETLLLTLNDLRQMENKNRR
jgi:hypothetical protein